MTRLSLGLVCLAVASVGSAMTLQFANRWNGAVIVSSRYTTADSNSSRYLFGGYADNDAYISITDTVGNILATRRWDSVGGGDDQVVDVELAADGNVVVLVSTGDQLTLLGYNGDALAPTFEVALGTATNANAALFMHDGGPTYVAQKQAANTLIRQFDGSGTVNWSRSITQSDPEVGDLEGGPSGGIVYAGSSGNRGFARHYNSAGAQQWSFTSLGDNTPNNLIRRIVVDTDGSIVGIGTYDPTGAAPAGAAFYRIATNGAGVVTDIASVDGRGMSLVKRAANTFYGLVSDGASNNVYGYNRTTDVISLLSQVNGSADSIAIDPTPTRYYVNNYSASAPLTSGSRILVGDNNVSNFYSPQLQLRDFTRGPGTSMVGVGNRNRDAAYAIFDGNQTAQMYDQPVLAYTARTVTGVAHEPSGAAFVGSIYVDSGSGVQSTLTKFSASGAVLWYRNFSLPTGRFRLKEVLRGADGHVVVAGIDEIQNRLHIRKLDGATGTQLWARDHFAIGADSTFADAALGPNSEVYLSCKEETPGFLTQVRLRKLSATTGLETHTVAYAYLFSDVEQVQLQVTAGGVISTSIHGADTDATAIQRIFNLNLGFQNGFEYPGVATSLFTKVARNGDVVLAMLNNGGTVSAVRFDPATLTAEYDTLLASRASPVFIDCGPNDNMVILSGHSGGGYRIASIADGGGALLWDTVIEPSVNSLIGMEMDGNNNAFMLGEEPQGGGIQSAYAARYLSTGARSAQRRLAGEATAIRVPTNGQVWLYGDAPTRNQARQILITRYNY